MRTYVDGRGVPLSIFVEFLLKLWLTEWYGCDVVVLYASWERETYTAIWLEYLQYLRKVWNLSRPNLLPLFRSDITASMKS